MAKINFTAEHFGKLKELAGEALIKGTTFKGSLNTENTIYDLFHTCSVETLTRYHGNIKKEIATIEALDEWSLTDYQQKKCANLKKQQELISLLIGYQRNKAQQEADAEKLKALKAQYADLKESTKTPEDKLKEIEAAMAELEPQAAI